MGLCANDKNASKLQFMKHDMYFDDAVDKTAFSFGSGLT